VYRVSAWADCHYCNCVNLKTLIADRISLASAQELAGAKEWLHQLQTPQQTALLIEVCRELDYRSVFQEFASNPGHKLPHTSFDLMLRGWNVALGLLLPYGRGLKGVPLMESTDDSRHAAMVFLQQLGRSALLKQSVEMLRHGMIDGIEKDDVITLRMSDRTSIDHVLDHLEPKKLEAWWKKFDPDLKPNAQFGAFLLPDIDARMEPLLFPWKTDRGAMVGYGAEPEIDNHFLALISESIVDWRNEAGLHPDAFIGQVPCRDIIAVVSLLTASYVKHLRFVELGRKKLTETNYAMSLTIWKTESELCDSLAGFTGMERTSVAKALDLITIRPEQHNYFDREVTTIIPLLIEISDRYLLSPVSSIFKNAFHGIRMIHDSCDVTANALREPREAWMRSDLYSLFQGNRYETVDRPTLLKADGHTVTDIDAAVLDRTTGVLALFQLKWQDFSSGEIRKQRSKAKNFVERVDNWAAAVQSWITTYGLEALCQSLRLNFKTILPVGDVRLFAIGRSVARFQSYGYRSTRDDVGVCTWTQFARCRLDIGPVENVVHALHERIQREIAYPVKRKAIPHEIQAAGKRVVFEDLWFACEDED
jgi:hypothetical protein